MEPRDTQPLPESVPDGQDATPDEAVRADPFPRGRKGSRIGRIEPFQFGLLGGLGVLLALFLGGLISQLSTVIVYIGIAMFLALGLDPLVTWLEKKMPRALAITVVMVAVALAFAGLLWAVVPIIIDQISNLIRDVPRIITDIQNSQFFQDLQDRLAQINFDLDGVINSVRTFFEDSDNWFNIGGGVLSVGFGIVGGITGVVIVFILMLYFLASLPNIKRAAYRFVPAYRREGFARVTDEITGAVGRYVVGQVTLAAINGLLSLILLSVIGAPLPLLLAVIAFIGSLIPLVGTLTGAIINSLICLFISPLTALIAAIYYLIYMQVEAYVLSPRIMNRAVAVPGALVVIAAVAGGAIGGILGALVAIPIAASIIIIVQKVIFPRQDARSSPHA